MNSTTRQLIIALALATALFGCADQSASNGSAYGTVSMALTSTMDDGSRFRITSASLKLTGPQTAGIDLDAAYTDDAMFEVIVASGEYSVFLTDGWQLERAEMGKAWEPVSATLISANPQVVQVTDGGFTTVSLHFTAGESEVALAFGGVEVAAKVADMIQCRPGERVARSCGENFLGEQFVTCFAGEWSDWSDCEMPAENADEMCIGGPSIEEVEASACEAGGFVAQQKDQLITVLPFESEQNASDFYGYGTANGASSGTGFEASDRATIGLHRDPQGVLSVHVVLDAANDGSGGGTRLQIDNLGLARMVVADDPNDPIMDVEGGKFEWVWGGCCTDGVALELKDDQPCLTFTFSEMQGLTGVDIMTGHGSERVSVTEMGKAFTICAATSCMDPVVATAAQASCVSEADCEVSEVCGTDGLCWPGCETTGCPEMTQCTPEGLCKAPTACVPACEGRECGDDGCGGVCGTCPAAAPVCNDTFQCEVPPTCPEGQIEDCDGICADANAIGDGTCDPELFCETHQKDGGDCDDFCGEDQFVCGDLQCVGSTRRCDQVNDCADGSDESGCVFTDDCSMPYEAIACDGGCAPAWRLGNDECDTAFNCAEANWDGGDCQVACAAGEVTACDGSCIAFSNVADGACDEALDCEAFAYDGGDCAEVIECQPNCLGRTCGTDGCGGSCGTCEEAEVCEGADDSSVTAYCSSPTPAEPVLAFAPILDWDAYVEATENYTEYVEDFETTYAGAEVGRAVHKTTSSDAFSMADYVTFSTASASDLPHPSQGEHHWEEGVIHDEVVVAGDSAKWQNKLSDWTGGDTAILAASDRRNKAGHDAIEARFSEPVRVAAFDLSTNVSGFTMAIYVGEDVTPVETFEIPAGSLFVGVEVSDEDGESISAVRLIPNRDISSPNGTYWWSMWEARFAM